VTFGVVSQGVAMRRKMMDKIIGGREKGWHTLVESRPLGSDTGYGYLGQGDDKSRDSC
jgi:hypothetical protein